MKGYEIASRGCVIAAVIVPVLSVLSLILGEFRDAAVGFLVSGCGLLKI